jgi:hypothetical protein
VPFDHIDAIDKDAVVLAIDPQDRALLALIPTTDDDNVIAFLQFEFLRH